jgi:hypothetical protein
MFDKVGQAAESLATHVSRRGFMGSLGKGALALAGVLGGVLAFASDARARSPGRGSPCCSGLGFCYTPGGSCTLVSQSCSGCVWNCGSGKIVTSACIR